MRSWMVVVGFLLAGCSDSQRSCAGPDAAHCCQLVPESACMQTASCHLEQVTSVPGTCSGDCINTTICYAAMTPVEHTGDPCSTLDEAACGHRDDCILYYDWDGVMSTFARCEPLFVPD